MPNVSNNLKKKLNKFSQRLCSVLQFAQFKSARAFSFRLIALLGDLLRNKNHSFNSRH